MQTTSAVTMTMTTTTGTFTPVLPMVMNVVLGDRATLTEVGRTNEFFSDGASALRQFPVTKAGEAVLRRNHQADLRPPPRWGLNE